MGLYAPSPAIEDENPAGEAARRRAGAYLLQHAQREFTIPGITLGARYSNSPAIINDDTPLPPDAPTVYVPCAKPGGRAPHVWMEDGSSLFDKLGFEWNLLDFTEDSSNAKVFQREAERLGIEMKVVKLHDHPVAIDLYERKLALIRPDQIVACRVNYYYGADVITTFDQILTAATDAR